MSPFVVHCKRSRFDIYIGRPSIWGNKFILNVDGNREQVIRKYEAWLKTQADLLKQIPTLRFRTLGCWCAPVSPCHGETLVRLANAADVDEAVALFVRST